jgi:hypothetical protein
MSFEDKSLHELVSLYETAVKSCSGEVDNLKEMIRVKYYAIPEEDRRYFDVDSKDSEIKQILKIK